MVSVCWDKIWRGAFDEELFLIELFWIIRYGKAKWWQIIEPDKILNSIIDNLAA